MSQPMSEGSQYLQRLIRHCAATAAITAAFAAGPLAGGAPDRFAEMELILTAPDGLPQPLLDWLAPLGETAYTGLTPGGAAIVTTDGLTIRLALNQPVPAGAQPLFDRGADPGPAPAGGAAAAPDLAAAAARFWGEHYQAAAAIGREQPLTAHGRLESCRQALVDLYRLALAPGHGQGWEGADGLPGAAKVMDGLREWLVTPLDRRAQWRCACHLAETYEQLMLPLAERFGFPYPWTMRNLAFRRLDEIRPDRSEGPEGGVPRLRDTAADTPAAASGPARVKVRIRRRES